MSENIAEQNASRTEGQAEIHNAGQNTQQASKAVSEKGKGSIRSISAVAGAVCLLFQIVLFATFTLGALSAYERNLTPISAIEFMLDLFFFQWSRAQQYLLGIVAGVAYWVIFVMLIVNFVFTCKTYSALLHGSEPMTKDRIKKTLDRSARSFRMVMIYSVAINSFTDSELSIWFLLVMALQIISYVLGQTAIRSVSDQSRSERIIASLGDIIAVTIVCLLYWVCKEPAGDNALTGMSMLFGGFIGFDFGFKAFVYSFFCNIVEPALNIALIILILKLIGRFYDAPYREATREHCVKTTIYSVVVFGSQFLFRTFFSFQSRYLSIDMLSEWFLTVRTFNLPVFLLLFAFWLILKFTPHRETKERDKIV